MRLVRVEFCSPEGSSDRDFIFTQDQVGEKWAKKLSNIRQSLPYSSVIDDGGVTLWSVKLSDDAFIVPDKKLWQSGQ
jgi:hypothetical protein